MAKHTPQQRFDIARASLVATAKGQEASMYGPLRDLFIEVLGYPPPDVVIDVSGARGRPDIPVLGTGPLAGGPRGAGFGRPDSG